jgi:hypothetical protein
MGTLGQRCAACHQAAPATIAFPKVLEPRGDPDPRQRVPGQMAHHEWAAARMWEGLIGPSDALWTQGAAALARTPMTLTAEAGEPGHDLGIADDAARLHLYGTRAGQVATLQERSQLFGDLLATCAHCHSVIRDR